MNRTPDPTATDSGPQSPSSGDHPDAALIVALRGGEPAAFETLVRDQAPALLATARRMLGNEEDACDALQDAFLSAFRTIGSFESKCRLSTWLHRVVVNSALMKLRSRRCRPESSIEDLLPRFHEDGHHVEPLCPWGDEAERSLQSSESRALVWSAIDRLPASYREVVVLRDIEGLSTEQTASLLGTTANAVKIRLHRARQGLRTLLDHHFRDES